MHDAIGGLLDDIINDAKEVIDEWTVLKFSVYSKCALQLRSVAISLTVKSGIGIRCHLHCFLFKCLVESVVGISTLRT